MLVLASMWLRKSAACDCISRLLMLVSCPASLLDNVRRESRTSCLHPYGQPRCCAFTADSIQGCKWRSQLLQQQCRRPAMRSMMAGTAFDLLQLITGTEH